MRFLVVLFAVFMLFAASCGSDVDGTNSDEPRREHPTAEPDEDVAPEPGLDDRPVSVAAFFDGDGERSATTTGFVVVDAGGARLCEVLMESYPAQCGGMWLAVANPDAIRAEFDEAQEVAWTPNPVVLDVWFDGSRLFVDDDMHRG